MMAHVVIISMSESTPEISGMCCCRPVRRRTAIQMSLDSALLSIFRRRIHSLRVMSLLVIRARAPASSVRPALISLFFRPSLCFTSGVTYSGSREVLVTVRSGQNLFNTKICTS
jgi:hypothetical protein